MNGADIAGPHAAYWTSGAARGRGREVAAEIVYGHERCGPRRTEIADTARANAVIEVLTTILSAIVWLASTLLSIAWWIVSTLLWAIVWFLLPFAIVAFIALRVAEGVLGPDVVRGWIKRQSMKFGASAFDRVWGRLWTFLRRASFAVSVLPLRVVGWFIVYTVWHSLISLFWKPKWQPWTRAWAKRWKPPAAKGTIRAKSASKPSNTRAA